MRDFDVEHTKRMHLIVVRRDLTGFQHLHPTQRADGTWSVPVTLPRRGSYRVFADFSRRRQAVHARRRPRRRRRGALAARCPRRPTSVDVDGLRVALTEGATAPAASPSSRFTVTRDGRPVAVQDYLGAKGHLVALREGDLAFLHVHPDENRLRFDGDVPDRGPLPPVPAVQDADGRVHTAAFTQEVTR